MSEVLTIEETGKLTLPTDIVQRFKFEKESRFRVIETQNGVLIIPFSDEPMSGALKAEIEEWQAVGADVWENFDYEEFVS